MATLRQKVRVLTGGGEIADRIAVRTLSDIAAEDYATTDPDVAVAGALEDADALETAANEADDTTDPASLQAEWDQIVDAWAVPDEDTYRNMPRLGRKVRMAAGPRAALWSVFAAARARLTDAGLMTRAQILHAVAAHYRTGAPAPSSDVVVDEAQDIAVPELHLLAAIAGKRIAGKRVTRTAMKFTWTTSFIWGRRRRNP